MHWIHYIKQNESKDSMIENIKQRVVITLQYLHMTPEMRSRKRTTMA